MQARTVKVPSCSGRCVSSGRWARDIPCSLGVHPAAGCQRDEGHHSGHKVPQLHRCAPLQGGREWNSPSPHPMPQQKFKSLIEGLGRIPAALAVVSWVRATKTLLFNYQKIHIRVHAAWPGPRLGRVPKASGKIHALFFG